MINTLIRLKLRRVSGVPFKPNTACDLKQSQKSEGSPGYVVKMAFLNVYKHKLNIKISHFLLNVIFLLY